MTDAEFATLVGVSGELVRCWRHGIRAITAKRAIEISRVTGIPRHELRPDLWEPPAPWPTAKRAASKSAASEAATGPPSRSRQVA